MKKIFLMFVLLSAVQYIAAGKNNLRDMRHQMNVVWDKSKGWTFVVGDKDSSIYDTENYKRPTVVVNLPDITDSRPSTDMMFNSFIGY